MPDLADTKCFFTKGIITHTHRRAFLRRLLLDSISIACEHCVTQFRNTWFLSCVEILHPPWLRGFFFDVCFYCIWKSIGSIGVGIFGIPLLLVYIHTNSRQIRLVAFCFSSRVTNKYTIPAKQSGRSQQDISHICQNCL